MVWARTWAIAACVVGALGCDEQAREGTLGEAGRVEFRFQRSCFFGCPLDQPLLEGTRERISLDGPGDGDGVVVSSADPDVLEVAMQRDCFCRREDGSSGRLEIADDASCDGPWEKHCDNDVLVAPHQSGDTDIELRDADGKLVDRTTVHARRADDARFSAVYPDRLGAVEGDAFELAAGAALELEVELYDDEGRVLLAPEGVTWRVGDTSVAQLDAFLVGRGEEVDAGLSLQVEAVASGETEVTVEVPGLTTRVTVTVVDP